MKTWLRYAKNRNDEFDWRICAALAFSGLLILGAIAYVGVVVVLATIHAAQGDWTDAVVVILAAIAWIAIIAGSRWSSRVLRDR